MLRGGNVKGGEEGRGGGGGKGAEACLHTTHSKSVAHSRKARLSKRHVLFSLPSPGKLEIFS